MKLSFTHHTGGNFGKNHTTGDLPLQALKYPAYCPQMTVEDVVGNYTWYRNTGKEKVLKRIERL